MAKKTREINDVDGIGGSFLVSDKRSVRTVPASLEDSNKMLVEHSRTCNTRARWGFIPGARHNQTGICR